MRKLCAAMAITVASLALFEGCAPVPLPHYAAYKPRRVEELLVDSENMRQAGDDWERFWLLDQPSHLTPVPHPRRRRALITVRPGLD